MRARFIHINEKFEESSDAIHDMGIGEPEYRNLTNAYKELDAYMNFDVEDLEFGKVINTLDYLRRISAYNVAMYFNRKYDFYVKIVPENTMGGVFAEGKLENYRVKFSTSGPGKVVYVGIYEEDKRYPVAIGQKTHQTLRQQIAVDVPAMGGARTIRALDSKFRHYCKLLDIDIKKYEK